MGLDTVCIIMNYSGTTVARRLSYKSYESYEELPFNISEGYLEQLLRYLCSKTLFNSSFKDEVSGEFS